MLFVSVQRPAQSSNIQQSDIASHAAQSEELCHKDLQQPRMYKQLAYILGCRVLYIICCCIPVRGFHNCKNKTDFDEMGRSST
jgi:hypothetical protein